MGGAWRLAGYRVEQLLGTGAFGEVWRATVKATGSPVALKRIPLRDLAQRDAAVSEAAVLGALDHPNLIRLHRLERVDGAIVLVLDLASAGSLHALLAARGRLTPGEAISALAPIGAALAHAHAAGVVHGDVTPANILFSDNGLSLLGDLGVARLVGDRKPVHTTLPYADPLVAAGYLPEPASDVYMLGAVTLHALTGHAPPSAAGEQDPQVWTARLSARLTRAQVPGPLSAVVVRAMSLEAHLRGTAADFALELRHAGTPVAVELTAGRARTEPTVSRLAAIAAGRPAGTDRPGGTGRHGGVTSRWGEVAGRPGEIEGGSASADRGGAAVSGSASGAASSSWSAPGAASASASASGAAAISRLAWGGPGSGGPGSGGPGSGGPGSGGPGSGGPGSGGPGSGGPGSGGPGSDGAAPGAPPLTRGVRLPNPMPPARHRARGRRLVLPVAILLGAVLVLGCVAVWWRAGSATPPLRALRSDVPPESGGATSGATGRSDAATTPEATRPARAGSGGESAARARGPLDVAEALRALDVLDSTRARAFRMRDPQPLADVYRSRVLLARDRAALLALVPPGCGLDGVRTHFSDVRMVRADLGSAQLSVSATLQRSTLRCGHAVAGHASGTPPARIALALVRTEAGWRIAGQHPADG